MFGRIDWKAERRRASDLLSSFGLEFDTSLPTAKLSPAQRTTVAIIRALQHWDESAGLLVLDEATAALPRTEVMRLFQFLRSLVERGASVLFVSHRLEEVLAITDRIGVLRDGVLIGEYATHDIDEGRLVSLVAGRTPIKSAPLIRGREPGAVVLTVEHLAGDTLVDLSFEVRSGELIGITGITGSGREEVAQLLSGANRSTSGTILLDRQPLPPLNPRTALAKGIASVPVDRVVQGLIPSFPLRENLTLPLLRPLVRYMRIRSGRERQETLKWIDEVGVLPRDPERVVGQLSGGNQQKLLLAKWLRTNPRVLVLDEPTQGVDVGAKVAIHRLLVEAAASGKAVILCSVELKDLSRLCDRVIVLRDGRRVKELAGKDLSEHRLMLSTLGIETAGVSAGPDLPTTSAGDSRGTVGATCPSS